MKIKTASGVITTSKRSFYGKFVRAYVATGAFSGASTLAAACTMARDLKEKYPSLSANDIGRQVGIIFLHKPASSFLDAFTGRKDQPK